VLGDQYYAIGIAIVCIAMFEAWRRRLRHRAPRWVHPTAIALFAVIAASVVYAEYSLRNALSSIEYANPANKASQLARSISGAMNANAVAMLATVLAAVVLAIGSWRARRAAPSDATPLAQLR